MSQSYASSSTGQAFTAKDFLDVHFEANRVEYAALLGSVGLLPGMQVLDAGAGGGNYLPLISEHVGPSGHITALDLAPEHVELMSERIVAWDLECPVDIVEGSVLDLSFDAGQFDAVWCANTTQYLSDNELETALLEFRRVTKPGGLVAMKDVDGYLIQFQPVNPDYLFRAILRERDWASSPGAWRTWNLKGFLDRAGFAEVWSRSSLIEHRAPLSTVERQLWTGFLGDFFARTQVELARQAGIEGEELQFWIDLRDDTPDSVINHPHFYAIDGQVLAVGRVPV